MFHSLSSVVLMKSFVVRGLESGMNVGEGMLLCSTIYTDFCRKLQSSHAYKLDLFCCFRLYSKDGNEMLIQFARKMSLSTNTIRNLM